MKSLTKHLFFTLLFLLTFIHVPARAAIGMSDAPITLTLASNTNPDVDFDLGHAFLVIRNQSGSIVSFGDYQIPNNGSITLGLRGGAPWIKGCGGSYINVEAFQAGVYRGIRYASTAVTRDQLSWIYNYFATRSSYYTDEKILLKNCTTMASTAWNHVATGLDNVIWDNIPGDLKLQIAGIFGSKSGTLSGSGLLTHSPDASEVFYIDKDGKMHPGSIKEGAPSLNSTASDEKSITLKWTGPSKIRHPFTQKYYANGYLIEWSKSGSTSTSKKFVKDLSSTSTTLSGLKDDTEYSGTITTVYRFEHEGEYIYVENASGSSVSFSAKTKEKPTIKISPTRITLIEGKQKTLKVKVTGESKKVTWKNRNPEVASVSKYGNVKARKPGTTIITVSANGKTATCKVTVVAEYKKLYKTFLQKNETKGKRIHFYYVLNVDKIGVPELVCCYNGGGMAYYEVFTVKKHKVVSVGTYGARGVSVVQPTFSYSSTWKGLIASGWTNFIGGSWSMLYTIQKGKLTLTQKAYEYYENTYDHVYEIYTSGTRVSRSVLIAYYNKYFKHAKSYKTKANTAANRDKSFGKNI